MRILFLAPQPFFQERGTPIAVRLALEVLVRRRRGDSASAEETKIDLLTYHEGEDLAIDGLQSFRIKPFWPFNGYLRNIGPGISFKKLLCDVLFLFSAFRLVWRARGAQYDVVHAVEESVFVALLIKWLFGIPYIYDMDSSLSLQISEKWRWTAPLVPVLKWLERMAVRSSAAVAPVCDALGVIANQHGAKHMFIIRDISLVKEGEGVPTKSLREELNELFGSDPEFKAVGPQNPLVVYIGNLEAYQGIELLLRGFAEAAPRIESTRLVIIGGVPAHIEEYRRMTADLKVAERVHFLGPRPVGLLGFYMSQADILVSPRTKGNNTPMKIFSYLHSGRAILASDRPTHTEVMTKEMALLVKPEIADWAEGLVTLAGDESLRSALGSKARAVAEERYTFDVFSRELNRLYDQVDTIVVPGVFSRTATSDSKPDAR